MTSKHTPGPWGVSHGGHGSPHGFVIDEYYVLNRTLADDVAIAADIVDPATQMPSEANARLIAAAPELLEALRFLLPHVEHAHADSCGDSDSYNNAEVPSCGCGLDAAVESAHAAIAKATGEA
jgi:hypothetical protein